MDTPPPPRYEQMTEQKIRFNFQVYWTKMGIAWSAEQRQTIRQQALALTTAPNFEPNGIEKRYVLPVEGLPEQSHSGASLLVLIEVLRAFDALGD